MSDTVALPTSALTTRSAQSGVGACVKCGAALTTMAPACQQCGAAVTAGSAAEHAERVRQRLQEAVGDRYELLELLGKGGMGIVFRAREVALDREVALKVLALDPLLAPDAWARFEREAKLAARLDHPNVVPIFSVGQGTAIAYYTMRLVRGGNVEDLLAGGRQLDLTQTSAILRDVAAALDYAHRLGVVHRDIKPANILLGEGGHASVADFGIAKALGPADGTTATGTGVIGSPGYMSPEQWRGETVDGRADQYALGVVAYEMLAGRRPFETVRVQDLLKLHLSAEVPDVSALRPELDPAVGAAIQRALAKYPSDRFPTVAAFVETLAGRRPTAAPVTTRATRATLATPRVAPKGSSAGGGAATVVLLSLLLTAAGVGAAAFVPATRPTVLHGWDVARAALASALPRRAQAVAAAVRSPSAPAAETAATADGVATSVAADSAILAADSATWTSADSGAAQPARVRERAPIGLDPALLGAAALGAPDGRLAAGRGAPGYVRVVTRGGSARVRVDGQRFGFTPQLLRVDAGPHVVTVEGAGDAFLPSQLRVEVVAGDTAAAVFTPPGWGRARPDSATPTERGGAAQRPSADSGATTP